ncbi:hypothetical protein NUU61_008521 [Penicillium alfredii]|uniref:Sulfatase N-terminal domain-containing protein n=1 Tax=Penicillium alfredii TaxID=1506179 RepID=A0A9W9JWT0_9EURO|nr:uncharacterized protein NUU61_008521 [Penicillium alfredii]KAJ5083942.1 hypothetical protein NUU61_008521 [Penicillium alfredii]
MSQHSFSPDTRLEAALSFVSRVPAWASFLCCALPARALQATLNWSQARKYWYSLLFIAVVSAKLLRIWSHLISIPFSSLLGWGSTFFCQDVLFLTVIWVLCLDFDRKWLRVLSAFVVVLLALILSCMSAANASFYILTGAEIHWRQAGSFNRDPASMNTLLTGLTGMIIVEGVYIVASWIASAFLFDWVDSAFRILGSCFAPLTRCWRSKSLPSLGSYNLVPFRDDDDEEDKANTDPSLLVDEHRLPQRHPTPTLLKRVLVLLPALLVLALRCARPWEQSYAFLSQTLIITPFVVVSSGVGDTSGLGDRTALTTPPRFDWLPPGEWNGFRDWQTDSNGNYTHLHYNPAEDPLHNSNLEYDVLEPLRSALHNGDVKIKHIFIFKLESTRYDVFPLRGDTNSSMLNFIRNSYKNGKIPDDVEKRLANLTHTAQRLTGMSSGFKSSEDPQPYGGVHFTKAYTSGTFTLKSLTGTSCGVVPLVVDFNQEYLHHIYQPCMPDILGVLSNGTDRSKAKSSDDFTTWPWRSSWMQSITQDYDHQEKLTPALGFPEFVSHESIQEDHANDTKWPVKEYNFWGYPDDTLRPYFRDMIGNAEKNHERLFVGSLTGLTHQPWDLPKGEKYDELIGASWSGRTKDVNRYLNTIRYNDRWFGEFLDILNEFGVADETLIVMAGDHGVSLPEDGSITPYDNPHVYNFHIPLVLSHPKLPSVQLDTAVTSTQILPSILDLLLESGSVDEYSRNALQDMIKIYEGQSLIRPQIETDELPYWQFTVMNTGGSLVAMRSATKPYRLIMPMVPEVEWRFTDIEKDPLERNPIQSFDLYGLKHRVAREHGDQALQWVQEAARAAWWWTRENWKRYEHEA